MPPTTKAGALDEIQNGSLAFAGWVSGPRAGKDGFTLVELLIVIAYLAILASLLLPILNRIAARGLTAQCLNNFKQMQICYRMYTSDNNDNLPLNNLGSGAGIPSWLAYTTVGASAQDAYNTQNIRTGMLYPYNQKVKLYVCPANNYFLTVSSFGAHDDYGNFLKLNSKVPETLTCSIEYSLGGGGNNTPSWTESFNGYTWRSYQKISSLQPNRISTKIVFVDEASGSIDDAAFAMWPMNTINNYSWNVPGSRHDRGSTFSFADGHVEYHRWLGTAIPGNPMQTSGPGNGGAGFPASPFWGPATSSADLADLAWVQAGGPQYP